MLGLMQDRPLLISQIIDFAARYYPDVEIVTRTVEGPIDRLEEIIRASDVDEVVIASSQLLEARQREIRNLCEGLGLSVRRAILE